MWTWIQETRPAHGEVLGEGEQHRTTPCLGTPRPGTPGQPARGASASPQRGAGLAPSHCVLGTTSPKILEEVIAGSRGSLCYGAI